MHDIKTDASTASWQPELDELAERQRITREMGGNERIARQHAGGRLTVRERIDLMLDDNSFLEVGSIAGKATYNPDGSMSEFLPANGVFGRGTVDGRPVVIYGDDFTVRGGSADASIKNKYFMPEKMAGEFRLPLIRMIEGSGGGGSVKTIETRGHANLPGGIGQS
jgi:acetyl-CoA carboxylase carboxyltransferase component